MLITRPQMTKGAEVAEISELEQRINAALDAISRGIEAKDAAYTAAPDDISGGEDLQEELEVERATTARLVASGEKNVARIERLETRVLRLTERLDAQGAENARLEEVIAALQDNNDKLRAANAEHQGDSDTVNAALASELDQLRAARAADRAELDEILAELAPIVKEA